MIDLRQMELFVAVAEELHFGRAAARSGMSQPPFSQQILRLERELGVALLHRTIRRVALTPAGVALLAGSREIIARRERVVDTVRRTASGDAGTLRIGFSASSAVGVLPMIVRQVRLSLPDVALQMTIPAASTWRRPYVPALYTVSPPMKTVAEPPRTITDPGHGG